MSIIYKYQNSAQINANIFYRKKINGNITFPRCYNNNEEIKLIRDFDY